MGGIFVFCLSDGAFAKNAGYSAKGQCIAKVRDGRTGIGDIIPDSKYQLPFKKSGGQKKATNLCCSIDAWGAEKECEGLFGFRK